MAYISIASLFAVVVYGLFEKDEANFLEERARYFECEAQGHDPAAPCDRDAYLKFTHLELFAVSFMLYFLLPLFNLLYLVSFDEIKQCCSRKKQSHFSSKNH